MSTDEAKNEIATKLPSHLANYSKGGDFQTGLEEMGNYIVPPRIKVIQDKHDDEVFQNMPSGDVIILPTLSKICSKDEGFHFTPIFTWDEFCLHNPYNRPKGVPFIRERTVDPKHEIAAKSRDRVEEVYPEDEKLDKMKYVTHLNFLIAIHDVEEMKGVEVLVSFFIGEFRTGSAFLNLLRMRTNGGIPIYGHIFEARPARHTNNKGNNWIGLDISNPTADYFDEGGSQYVTDENLFNSFAALHREAKVNKDRIQASFEEESGENSRSDEAPESDTL